MKLTLIKHRKWACFLPSGRLALTVNLLLALTFAASADPAQNADTRIAFMSTRSERNGEIFVMNADGRRVRRLTKHPQYDAVPAWSPDGQKITFMSFRDLHRIDGAINGEIYVMNPDGTNPINLTQSPERPDGVSSWSPDGKQIAFTSAEIFNGDGVFHWDIWVMDADGGNLRNLTNHHAQEWSPAWSPDGDQITFSSERDRAWEFEVWGNREVYVMNTDGANLINLTNHPARDSSPAWSPDGRQIAFSSDRDGNKEVYVMNADGTNPINLTNHPARDSSPAWSPDGLRIAFSTNRDGDWEKKPNDNWEVYVINADGANPINLTNHPAWDSSPAWAPAPTLSVFSKEKLAIVWGKVKRSNTYGGK